MKTILIVDDEVDMLELIEYTLQKEGYDTIGCLDVFNVESLLEEEKVDLILMDRNMPDCEGSVYIKKLREKGFDTPVILVTAKSEQSDILSGFEAGCDDYITKPFNIAEFKARVRSVIGRGESTNQIIRFRDIIYNEENSKVQIENVVVELTLLEKRILLEFLKNKNRLLTRNHLLTEIWKDGDSKQEKTVNVAINRLKDKIDADGSKQYIKAVRGEGYILDSNNN